MTLAATQRLLLVTVFVPLGGCAGVDVNLDRIPALLLIADFIWDIGVLGNTCVYLSLVHQPHWSGCLH